MTDKVDYQELANDDISASISTRNVHDHLKSKSVAKLRLMCDEDRLPFSVCVLNVTGELNVGTIVRNSLLTGAERVAIMGRRKYDKRGTVGSENYVEVERIEALEDDGITIKAEVFWNWVAIHNYLPVFCEQGGTSLNEVDWLQWVQDAEPGKLCLIFGNENRGIPDSILNDRRSNWIVSIPQKGVIRSFNVGVASGIIMYSMMSELGWL